MNPREIRVCFEGYKEKIRVELENQDYLNFLLGKYIAIGVASPKKYPHEPFLMKAKKNTKKISYTDEDRERQAKLRWSKKKG